MAWFSRKSFKVALTGISSGIVYEEGGRCMQIDCELMGKPSSLIVYTNTMKWRPPHDTEPIGAEEIERIKANVTQHLSGLTLKWE